MQEPRCEQPVHLVVRDAQRPQHELSVGGGHCPLHNEHHHVERDEHVGHHRRGHRPHAERRRRLPHRTRGLVDTGHALMADGRRTHAVGADSALTPGTADVGRTVRVPVAAHRLRRCARDAHTSLSRTTSAVSPRRHAPMPFAVRTSRAPLGSYSPPMPPRGRTAIRRRGRVSRCCSGTARRRGAIGRVKTAGETTPHDRGSRRSPPRHPAGASGGRATGTGPKSDMKVSMQARTSGSASMASLVLIQNGGTANTESSPGVTRMSNRWANPRSGDLGTAASNARAGSGCGCQSAPGSGR